MILIILYWCITVQSVSLFDALLVSYLLNFSFFVLFLIVAYKVFVYFSIAGVPAISQKAGRICASVAFVMGVLCFQTSYMKHAVDVTKLFELANAEKSLLQQKVYMERNKSLNEKAIVEINAWVKEMRKATADGKVTFGEYINLYSGYTELDFIAQPMYKWFSENGSDKVESEIRTLMSKMPENAAEAKSPELPETPASEATASEEGSVGLTESEAAAMDQLIGDALSKN